MASLDNKGSVAPSRSPLKLDLRPDLVGRFVNVGTIVLTSSDKSHPVVALIGIDDPLEVAELIDQACHRERDRRGVYVEQV